jgi:hypothetical protein
VDRGKLLIQVVRFPEKRFTGHGWPRIKADEKAVEIMVMAAMLQVEAVSQHVIQLLPTSAGLRLSRGSAAASRASGASA